MGAELAVELAVGAHDSPGVGFFDSSLERAEIQLAKWALCNLNIDAHALDFGVVGDEVFHRHGYVVTLHPADVRDR